MKRSIQELRERRAALAAEARAHIDGDQWNKEIEEKVDAIYKEIEDIDGQITRSQKLLDIEAQNAKRAGEHADRNGTSDDEANADLEMQRGIFSSWLAGGPDSLNAAQREYVQARRERAASIFGADQARGTDSLGGYLTPDDFAANLLEELLSFGGVRSVATILQTDTGNKIEWPTVDETGETGELVAENASVADQDITFGIKEIDAYKYSSKGVAVSFELLQDSRIDLAGYIGRALATRLARITNTHYTTGTGTGQPNGIVTASAQGKVGTTGQTTTVIYDDLVDLEHSVDPAYRIQGCSWMFNDATLKALKKLKDDQSRPIWLPGLAVSEPDTILSYPYTINQDVAVMAASARSILFGAMKKYLVRDVMQVLLFRMTDSVYTRAGQVGFLSFMRTDGELIDSSNSAIKHYANSAT